MSLRPNPLPSDVLPPGTVLDRRYRLNSLVEQSPRTHVYTGTHLLLGRSVRVELLRDAREDRRFRRSARLLSMMSHPNIVRVYDMGLHAERPFLVLEHLEGTLAERLSLVGAFRLADFARVAEQLLDVLTYVHARNVIHRDISLHSLHLVEQEKRELLKLSQFGASKDLGAKSITLPGQQTLVSSLVHVAPERILDEPLDHRSDIYSAGTVLYHVLTGAPPFRGKSIAEIGTAILESVPTAPDMIRADCPAGLSTIIARALAKRAEDRYASAQEMASELRAVIATK